MTEVAVSKPITLKALIGITILSAILGLVGTLWHAFLPFISRCIQSGYGVVLSEPAEMAGLPFLILMWVLPLMLLSPAIRRKVNAQTLTYLYVTGLCVAGFSNFLTPWCNFLYFAGSKGSSATPPEMIQWIPSVVAVPADVADSLLLGGVQNIPWGTWIPVMIWYFLFIGLFAIMSVAVANIFRREWIDVEKVVFPQVMLATETLVQVGGGDVARNRKRSFIVGLLIGIVFTVPLALITIFPWFPDIYAWRSYTCGPGSQQIPPDSGLYSIPGIVHFAKHPLAFAVAYTLPMSILFSGWFFMLIYEVLVNGAYALGYYTALPNTGSCGRIWCGEVSPLIGAPLMLRVVGGGGLFGLGIMVFFLQRRYIGRTLQAALGKLSRDELQAFEKDEPTSYRNSWAMLAVSFILLIALLIGTGFSFVMSFLIVLLGVLIWIWQTRIFGLAGLHIEASGAVMWVPRVLFYPVRPQNLSTDFVLGSLIWQAPSGRHPLDGWGQSMFSAFGSYRMASLTGTSSKDVFKVSTIALLVSAFVGLIAFVWGASNYGVGRLHGTTTLWASSMDMWSTSFMNAPSSGPPNNWALPFFVGILLTVAMSLLHSRFAWFPHPIGPVFAWSFASALFGWWFAFLVAWILKLLTLRIGGSKLYEQMGLPLVGGVTSGYVLITFIFGIVGIIRFFFPF